jgi:hypothetical protein
LDKADLIEDSDDELDVAAAEIMWGKEPLTMNQFWVKQTKGTYDFDITKADKLFEILVKEGRLPGLQDENPKGRPGRAPQILITR